MTLGKFIVVEGLEGAGKSTAVGFIEAWLVKKNIPHIRVREPGATPLAEKIRSLVKSPDSDEKISPMTELLLMYAARAQLVSQVIQPALNEGSWVIGDRHELSTRAYQGGGRGIEQSKLESLYQICLNGFKPNLTFYLDIDPKIGFERILQRGKKDRIEQEDLAFFERVRKVYCEYAAKDPSIHLIHAERSAEKVAGDIQDFLNQWSQT